MRVIFVALIGLFTAFSAGAEDREWIGNNRLYTNDIFGDADDRWRTSSYTMSFLSARDFDGELSQGFGSLIEYRLRAEIIAPENLSNPVVAPDRPYAGVIGLGAFSHFDMGGFDAKIGGELVFTGPMTGLGRLQSSFHKLIGQPEPAMLASQLPNKVYPTVQAEFAKSMGQSVIYRPFVDVQAGIETYARLGGDIIFGRPVTTDMIARDTVTGMLVPNAKSEHAGMTYQIGADMAYINSSQLLPTASGYQLERGRFRVRAGAHYRTKNVGIFYGATYLSEEFKAEREGQVVGSIHLKIKF